MQTSPDRLSDLIARLEKATGPCRKLDLDISVAVNYRDAFTGAIRAEWSRHRGANGKMTMQVDGPGPIGCHGQGATPAIALVIAALKARMQGGNHG